MGSFTGLCGCPFLYRIQVVKGHTPFEGGSQQHRAQRLEQVARPPFLITRDPQNSKAEVIIHADDVGEDVVAEVVRALPRRGRRGGVPLPGARVDRRVAHPIPLTVDDVMGEFHVLDAFGYRQGAGAQHPSGPSFAHTDDEPCRDLEASLNGDGAPDVCAVLHAERILDVATNRVQLDRERLYIRIAQMGVFRYFGNGHRCLPRPGKGEVRHCLRHGMQRPAVRLEHSLSTCYRLWGRT